MVDPQIVILGERESPSGLDFSARVEMPDAIRTVRLHLHWADYNLWSPDGSDSPERVAQAVLRFACSRARPNELPATFDAATLRRRHADADEAIAALVRRRG